MKLLSTVSTLLSTSLLTRACADDCYEPTKAPLLGMPGFEFLYTVNASLAPAIVVGAAPLANRTIYPITGGRFEGPKMKGSVLNLGADWGVSDVNGVFHPDTRYHLRTDDGAEIYIRTDGPGQNDGTIHLRAKFETASKDYYWLNYIIAVGILTPSTTGKYVVIDTWQMTGPKK